MNCGEENDEKREREREREEKEEKLNALLFGTRAHFEAHIAQEKFSLESCAANLCLNEKKKKKETKEEINNSLIYLAFSR